jgi:hypothetical protein
VRSALVAALLAMLLPRSALAARPFGGRAKRARALAILPPQTREPIELHPLYTRWLPELRRDVAPRLNPHGRIRRVFYPLGGADVAEALSLFEGPLGGVRELVITDVLPFGAPREVRAVFASHRVRRAFLGAADGVHERKENFINLRNFASRVKLTGPAMLWELEHLGATAIRMQYLDTHGRPRPPPVRGRADRVVEWSTLKRERAPFYDAHDRDVVRVDFVLGGERRSILYIQQDVLDGHDLAPVLTQQLARGIDAYVEKAPLELVTREPYQTLRDLALLRLHPEHGLVATDQPSTLKRAKELLPGHQAQRLRLDGHGFGYDALNLRVSAPWVIEDARPVALPSD